MITADRLREVLHYDPDSGVFRWVKCPGDRMRAGTVAGCLCDGYTTIDVDKRTYYAHRLAWLYQTGKWPDLRLDHRNMVRTDNRWANLREATDAQNKANRKKLASNTSGFKGVSWHKFNRKWRSRIVFEKREILLGYFDDPVKAHAAYAAKAHELYGEFARIR
jgi:hypothetical protein